MIKGGLRRRCMWQFHGKVSFPTLRLIRDVSTLMWLRRIVVSGSSISSGGSVIASPSVTATRSEGPSAPSAAAA